MAKNTGIGWTDHDADVEAEYGPGDYVCRALWNTIDDLEARGFTQGHIAQELLWLVSQVARGAGRCPEQAAEQVRYFRHMADCMSREAARIEQTFGVVGEAAAPETALVDAVTAGSA